MKKLITFGAMVAVFTMLLSAPIALAQDEGEDALIAPNPTETATAANSEAGLLISPVLNEVNVDPGATYNGTIKVTNISDKAVTVTTYVKDFFAEGETGEPSFYEDNDTSTFGLATWITLEKSFQLAVNETIEVPYAIAAPKNATPGGHYAAVLFSPSVGDSAGEITAKGMIGTLVLANVSGDTILAGSIAEFMTGKGVYSYDPVLFTTKVQNSGNTHFKPAGSIIVTNMFGSEVGSLIVNDTMGNVLPESVRAFTNEWATKGHFGWYKATLTLNYGGTAPLTATTTFFIIPWKETTIGVVVLILVIWLIVAATRKKEPTV